jgi:UDP-GlcNAc:undecaprenyl-phosphate GlcNAc-1-phosphate transferase
VTAPALLGATPLVGPPAAAVAFIAAALVVLFAIPPLRRFAWWSGYLDHPEARKQHIKATPLLGGAAVALGTAIGAGVGFAELVPLPPAAWWWAIGALSALAVGLIDDRLGMHPLMKLILQFGIAALFVFGGVFPHGGLGPWVGGPVGVLWLVAMMNAVNFLDNMDGIVGGMSAILAGGLGTLLLFWGHYTEATFAFALAGASLAFLRYNFPPAGIFLGDAGSLFLGYSLGALSLIAAEAGPDVEGSLAGLLIMGYPLFDLSFVVVTRWRDGRKIYLGGKDHTTHRLNQLLRDPRRTALGVYAFAFALTASGMGAAAANNFIEILPWLGAWTFVLVAYGLRLARVPVAPPSVPA